MIGKIIGLPFVLVKNIIGLIFGIIRLVVGGLFGVVRFVFGRAFGTVFGALVGLLLGQRHLGIRIFPKKKKK